MRRPALTADHALLQLIGDSSMGPQTTGQQLVPRLRGSKTSADLAEDRHDGIPFGRRDSLQQHLQQHLVIKVKLEVVVSEATELDDNLVEHYRETYERGDILQ